jgi:hypothetical protein
MYGVSLQIFASESVSEKDLAFECQNKASPLWICISAWSPSRASFVGELVKDASKVAETSSAVSAIKRF